MQRQLDLTSTAGSKLSAHQDQAGLANECTRPGIATREGRSHLTMVIQA